MEETYELAIIVVPDLSDDNLVVTKFRSGTTIGHAIFSRNELAET